jgi:hypothetical protein
MKTARRLSVFLLLITASTALYSGVQLVIDPTGSSLGFPFYLLNKSIFTDYLVTGWILTATIGVFSLVIIVSIFLKTSFYSFLTMVQGVIICIYVFMMMLLLGETFMVEYFFLLLGISLISLGALQQQRKIVVELERRSSPARKKNGQQRNGN